MNVVIIEDEQLTADDLMDVLHEINPSITVIKHLSSVQEGLDYFTNENDDIDLIFSDIQLGDGLSFELFKRVTVTAPIVFCTAFDEYAIEAFKSNGIDYILKPFSTNDVRKALERYKQLEETFTSKLQQVADAIEENTHQQSVLVYHKEKIIPIPLNTISLAYIRNEMVYLRTFEGESYHINKSLDELDHMLGANFYRANRQHIVNRQSVKDVTTFLTRKYLVNLNFPYQEQIIVSKEKMTSFLRWLNASV